MGYLSGTVQSMPRKGKHGEIISDDGTLFKFALLSNEKPRVATGGRVIFMSGSRNIARNVKATKSSHTRVGKPNI